MSNVSRCTFARGNLLGKSISNVHNNAYSLLFTIHQKKCCTHTKKIKNQLLHATGKVFSEHLFFTFSVIRENPEEREVFMNFAATFFGRVTKYHALTAKKTSFDTFL